MGSRVVLFLLLAFALPVEAETLRLSLPEAVGLALRAGTQAELARSAEERAVVARREAFGALLPRVDARLLRYSQSINLATFGFEIPGQPPVVGPFNVTDAQLAAAMQVFNLAALRRVQALRQAETASRYDVEAAENDVAAAVARLYLLVQRAATQVSSRQADVALFERLLKTAQDEFAAGTGTRLDVAQANVQVARARQALLAAENDEQTAKLALLNALGANEADNVTLAAVPPPSLPPGDAVARARAQRPELKELAAREAAARLGVEAARARRLPSVSFDYQGTIPRHRLPDATGLNSLLRQTGGSMGLALFATRAHPREPARASRRSPRRARSAGHAREARPGRRPRRSRLRGKGREPLRRHRRPVLPHPARQRLRKLREGRPARAGAHLLERPARGSGPGGIVGRGDRLHEVKRARLLLCAVALLPDL